MRRSKLMTIDQAAALVEPGMSVALGGAVHAGRPGAFVRALARRAPGKVVLYPSPGAGWDADLLIALGLVERVVIPMVTMGSLGMAPSFRAAVETGEVKAHEVDAMSRVAAYLAGAYGHPYHLIRSLEGTDIVADEELFDVLTDSQGNRHRAVRALVPDLCVLHVEEADEYGNARHAQGRVLDVLAARAAKRVIVQAERIVGNADVRGDARRTTVPGHVVAGVVHAPFGAHPSATAEYAADEAHLREYVAAAEARRRGDDTAFEAYVRRFIREPADEAGYQTAIGGAATRRRLRQELHGGSDD